MKAYAAYSCYHGTVAPTMTLNIANRKVLLIGNHGTNNDHPYCPVLRLVPCYYDTKMVPYVEHHFTGCLLLTIYIAQPCYQVQFRFALNIKILFYWYSFFRVRYASVDEAKPWTRLEGLRLRQRCVAGQCHTHVVVQLDRTSEQLAVKKICNELFNRKRRSTRLCASVLIR